MRCRGSPGGSKGTGWVGHMAEVVEALYVRPGSAFACRPCCALIGVRGVVAQAFFERGHAAAAFAAAREVLMRWPDGVAYWHPGPAARHAQAASRAQAVPVLEVGALRVDWLLRQLERLPPGVTARVEACDGELVARWCWPDGRRLLKASAPDSAAARQALAVWVARVRGGARCRLRRHRNPGGTCPRRRPIARRPQRR